MYKQLITAALVLTTFAGSASAHPGEGIEAHSQHIHIPLTDLSIPTTAIITIVLVIALALLAAGGRSQRRSRRD